MISDLVSVWTPGALTTAVVGGFVLGLVMSQFDNPRFDPLESAALLLVLGLLAGTVFWSGQIVDTLTTQGESLAWRVASRFGLFVVFILTMTLGEAIGMRRRRGAWR